MDALLVEPAELLSTQDAVVFDCRFSLAETCFDFTAADEGIVEDDAD